MMRPVVLTIAGSDPSGGAGIQADLKTMTVHGVYGMSVITALTVQNTLGVKEVIPVDDKIVEEQLHAVMEDIPPAVVKIGMVVNQEIIEVITEVLCKYQTKQVILDPVLVSSSGRPLLDTNAVQILKKELLPLCTLVTPNIPELTELTGCVADTREERIRAAEELFRQCGAAVLVKGGHASADADDILWTGEAQGATVFEGKRIMASNTHGTGCTLSSAIASNLANGMSLTEAVRMAKWYLREAMSSGLDLGQGNGPLDHLIPLSQAIRNAPPG